jgi:hypothetical protein
MGFFFNSNGLTPGDLCVFFLLYQINKKTQNVSLFLSTYKIFTKHGLFLQHVNREHLEIIVLGIVTVSMKHVIQYMVHVLMVDVNVDTKGLHVVQARNTDFALSDLPHYYLS